MSKVYRHSDGSYRDYAEFPLHKPAAINDEFGSLIDYELQLSTTCMDSGITSLPLLPKPSEEKKGIKHDSEKVPLDLIPYDALVEIGKVLQAGEKKYGTANWSNGIEMRRLLAAAMRHLGQFNDGEDFDEETNTLHIGNAATNLMFAIWMYKNRPDLDNRWAKKDKK